MLNKPTMVRNQFAREGEEVGLIQQSIPWISAGAVASLLFVFALPWLHADAVSCIANLLKMPQPVC